ncbi:hypothetical protein [Staphylococcus epidermidis]|uniref:hypothetical protein n=1 Tax=Staphylococcus epidermidis TaxID=1282 RepID=UPI0011A98505|nr:hypothetical protein [Staphylococcus epidermidis]
MMGVKMVNGVHETKARVIILGGAKLCGKMSEGSWINGYGREKNDGNNGNCVLVKGKCLMIGSVI